MNFYKSIAIKNIGIIKKRSEIKLGAITFVYGPNGSGKSTFIRSIEQFGRIRSLAIQGYPIRQEGKNLFERYGAESGTQGIDVNYGSEIGRISELRNEYFAGKDSKDFPVYLSESDLDGKEDCAKSQKDIRISLLHAGGDLGLKNDALLEVLGVKKGHYLFKIKKADDVEYFYNPDRSMLFNVKEISLSKLKKGFILPAFSYFRLSGRISEPNIQDFPSISCEWLTTKQTKSIKSLVEIYIAKQIYHLAHKRHFKRIEPLRTIIKQSDIASDEKSFMGLNMEKSALKKTNEWFINKDKFTLGMQIEDINYQNKSDSILSDKDEGQLLRKIVMKDIKSGKSINFDNVGTGISQIAPVLSWVFSKEQQLILIEQPEIHLHPAMQATLMDALIDAVKSGQQIVIETHSETFLLRALRRLKEGVFRSQSWDDILFQQKPDEKINDLEIYFFDKQENDTAVRHLRLDHEGRLIDDWPGGFFEEGIREVLI